jgi:hypothetical protein
MGMIRPKAILPRLYSTGKKPPTGFEDFFNPPKQPKEPEMEKPKQDKKDPKKPNCIYLLTYSSNYKTV